MKATWLGPLRPLGILWLASFAGCDDEQASTNARRSESSLAECAMPALNARTAQGRAQSALASPLTLPVPSSIAVSGGAANGTATLTYTLPADGNRTLSCRYRRAGEAFTLVNCDREVDATAWIEASAVELRTSDPRAQATLALCPVGGVADQAKLRPPRDQPGQRSERIANARDVGFDSIPGALNTQDVVAYVAAARAEPRVQRLLGERSAFVQELDASDSKLGNPTAHHLKLIFYSHTHSRTVEVTVNRNNVLGARYVDNYYPPEGKEEIDQAIGIAKQDPRLAGRVNDLRAGGMSFQHVENTSYLNHRVMDIRFYDDALVSKYFAVVDLTDLKVQAAGAVQ